MVTQTQSRSRFRSILRSGTGLAREEHGGTLVEFGFSAVLMLGLIMGIMQLSMAMYSYHCVSDAARAGTRYAMVRGSDWGSTNTCGTNGAAPTSGCMATTANIQYYVQNVGFLNGSNMTVTPQCATSIAGTFGTYGTTCNAATDVVQVQVSYPFSFGIPGFPRYTYQLKSTSEEVISY